MCALIYDQEKLSESIKKQGQEAAVRILRAAGYTVYEPGFAPHVLIEVEGGCVENVVSNAPIRCMVKDSDIRGMDDGQAIAGEYYITESDMFPPVVGPISDMYLSESIGGSTHENHALYQYFKQLNF